MKRSDQSAQIDALKDWLASQEIGPAEGTLILLICAGATVGTIASNDDELHSEMANAFNIFFQAAVRSHENKHGR